jgi:hypothetical protein
MPATRKHLIGAGSSEPIVCFRGHRSTREHGIVRDYIRRGGTVPGNLVIRISATMIDGAATAQWPTISTVSSAARPDGAYACSAPTQANKCGACRACWSPVVQNVDYHVH